MYLRNTLVSLLTFTLIFAGNVLAIELPGPTVNTEWLAKNLSDVQVADVRLKPKSFTSEAVVEIDETTKREVLKQVGGHVTNALLIPYKPIRGERIVDGQKVKYLLPEKAEFERLMQAAGLRSDLPIIIVTRGTTVKEVTAGLRLYWQLKYFGEDRVAVLDGGMAAWLTDGYEADVTPAKSVTGDWKATATRNELVANSDDVSNAEESVQLVDARSTTQYYGIDKRDYVSAFGHIKGAKMLPNEVLFRQDGVAIKFYSPEAYRSIMAMSDLKVDQPAIHYCNSGHLAAGPWFIQHELIGNKQARLFDGSMHQWTLQNRPVVAAILKPLPETCSPGIKTPGC
jgi:thiosulfate/3-mercaptopyruvate sulfurtransferase